MHVSKAALDTCSLAEMYAMREAEREELLAHCGHSDEHNRGDEGWRSPGYHEAQ